MKPAHPSDLLEFARDLATSAGRYLHESLGSLCDQDISYKGHIDLVTRVDRESERRIVAAIRERYPDHGVLGEEGSGVESSSGYCWVVDPLDGTTNFIHSFPIFCVSIACVKDDEPVVGAIYAPCLDELYWAEAGAGAHLNGRKLRVSSTAALTESLLCTGFASMRDPRGPDNIGNFVRLLRIAQGVRRGGSAALELAFVGAGRLEAFWEMNLSPWDVAAGALIVTEAGGRVTDMHGGPGWLRGKHLLATNGAVHDELLGMLRPEERFAGDLS